MLAVESARPKRASYYQPMAMDTTTSLVDMFSFPVDNIPYPQTTQYFNDPSLFAESAEFQKASNFPSMPATPPSVPTSHSHADSHVPTGSAASGPSIASASSSALGSPYSGNAQAFQDNWVNTNHGLGLPAAVMNDLFSNEFVGNHVDMDGLYQEKFPDTFVGMFDMFDRCSW